MSRNREAYVLKIAALSIGLATAMAIVLFFLNEFGYDTAHKNGHEVFRVLQKNTDEAYTGNRLSAKINGDFINTLTTRYHDSLILARVKIMEGLTVVANHQELSEQKVHIVDTTIGSIFTLNIVDGNIQNFKTKREARALVSSRFAQAQWGTTKIVGEKLKLYSFGDTVRVAIAAVFESLPQNSHETFDLMVSFDANVIRDLNFSPDETGVYGRTLVKEPAHYSFSGDEKTHYMLQPVTEIYFGPRILGEGAKHGDRYSVILLLCITALIFFLAITTFVNLTTLTLPYRSKELAIKKLAGTTREWLVLGFVKESCLVVGISLFAGLFLLLSAGSFIESTLGFPMMTLITTFDVTFVLIVATLSITLIISPIFMTMRFAGATPNRLLSTDTITFPALKRYIALVQLGVSIMLIIGSVVVRRQISYSLVKEPGQNHDQIVYLNSPSGITNEGVSALRSGWKKYNPNILDVMAVSQLPDRVTSKEIDSKFYQLAVDPGFRDFFSLRMTEGHWFDPNTVDSAIVLNPAAKIFQSELHDPALGVIEDINGFFNRPQKPTKLRRGNDYGYHWLCVRVLEVDIRRTVQQLSRQFSTSTVQPGVHYLSSHFGAWIDYQDRLNRLSAMLAVVAGLLSCCAVYGLSISLVRDKLKQIAIHRLFGASTLNITLLLLQDFARQLGIALVIFLPISFIMLNELLRTFIYATHLSWLDPVYPLAYCVVVIIAICAFQAWNLKRINSSVALKG